MTYPKRSQYQYAKSPYRIRNWPAYGAGLRNPTRGTFRGHLTIRARALSTCSREAPALALLTYS